MREKEGVDVVVGRLANTEGGLVVVVGVGVV